MDSDHEDDEMADLFSFGADSAPPPEAQAAATTAAAAEDSSNKNKDNNKSVDDSLDDMLDTGDDSFLELLDSNAAAAAQGDTKTGNIDAVNDPETQDILNWLEEDDTDADALLAAVADESAKKTQERQRSKSQELVEEEEKAKQNSVPTPAPLPPAPVFTSLKEALESSQATKVHILEQWEQRAKPILEDASLRPLLWSRIICGGKTIEGLTSSSLADSFQEFQPQHKDEALEQWVRTESAKLAPRIVRASPNVAMNLEEAEEALRSILLYQIHNNQTPDTTITTSSAEASLEDSWFYDPLLPPVVCAILSAGIPKLATPVLMHHLMPSFMPFLALSLEERWQASKLLHSQFYLLACYHLPMLVYHLDRYVPGWYWPQPLKKKNTNNNSDEKENEQHQQNEATTATQKSRNLKEQGVLPPSWLMTHLAGECNGTFLEPNRLLQLWDLVFTNENNSLRFFLVLAILEQHSDQWLELTGEELAKSISQRMQDSDAFSMKDWATRAKALKQATPESVVDRLRTAEDEAVKEALKERQIKSEAALKARLEAEAKAHQEAQERKAEEARNRLTRARLIAFYRRFNPSKEENVDKIMETYRDRFDELDKKLKKKYGVGFNPALNPNRKKKTMTEAANESMKKTMQSMNQGMEGMKKKLSTKTRKNPLEDDEDTDEIRKREHRVAVSVKVGETLPFFCMSREQANDIRRVCLQKDLPMPLRFYLVDSRPNEIAEQQGRFPTAAQLSPETLMDPELLQKYEDSFEGVRGSYHICVMGEGQSAIPALYNQRLTPELEEYMREDESRTNNVALFFIKRGFPFVSVLDGGFASAHAWLWREGRKKGFDANAILVDYHPQESLFGQMEKLRMQQKDFSNYTSREKTQRALQNLVEGSMTQLVKAQMKIGDSLASETEAGSTETSTPNTNGTSAAADDKPAQVQRKTSNDGNTGAGFKSFFNRGGAAAENAPSLFGKKPSSKRNLNEETEAPKDATPQQAPEASAAAPAPAAAQPQNRFSNWRQAAVNAIQQPQQAQQQQPQQGNRFGGFAKRNPFARFGGGGAAPAAAPAEAPRFAGLMNKVAKPAFVGRSASASTNAAAANAEPGPAPTIVALPPAPAPAPEAEESVDFVIDTSENSEGGDEATPATTEPAK